MKWRIVRAIEDAGYETEIFLARGLVKGVPWSPSAVDAIMRRCVGAALIGFTRWEVSTSGGTLRLPTDFTQYEGAVAYTMGLPIFAVIESGVSARGLLGWQSGLQFAVVSGDDDTSWLESSAFRGPFENWRHTVAARRDVFLGYESESRGTAESVRRFLEQRGLTIHDSFRDHRPGDSFMEHIIQAVDGSSGAIFILSGEDVRGSGDRRVRPNADLLFAIGHFVAAKGLRRVLVVAERSSELSASLAGTNIVSLDKAGITRAEPLLARFVEEWL